VSASNVLAGMKSVQVFWAASLTTFALVMFLAERHLVVDDPVRPWIKDVVPVWFRAVEACVAGLISGAITVVLAKLFTRLGSR